MFILSLLQGLIAQKFLACFFFWAIDGNPRSITCRSSLFHLWVCLIVDARLEARKMVA